MLDLKNIRFSPDLWYAIFINVVYKNMWLPSDTSIAKQTKPTLETGVASVDIRVIHISGLNIIYDL